MSIDWNMLVKCLFFLVFLENVCSYELKQVIVLSRHNIRTPLDPTSSLQLWSPRKWPSWIGTAGTLTPKGRLLERYMGKYFSDWMIQEKLLKSNCPKDQVFVYANNVERTIETAKAFVEGAFGDCVGVYYKNTTEPDPVFNLNIKNDSAAFRNEVSNEIEKKLNSTNFKDALLELNRIVDFGNSTYCKTEHVCDLSEVKNKIVLEVNKVPEITGALRIGFNLINAFLMAYYDGMAAEDVAWGQIQTTEQWKALLSIRNTLEDLRFGTKILSKHLASAFLKYFTNLINNGTKKFYLLVKHDANICSLLSSLGFKEYILQDQLEKNPIGGKLVFQKWYDEENDQNLLRVNYVYQSFQQIRDGAEASLHNPPKWDTLEMENCEVDENGFCAWDKFVRELNSI